MCINISISDAHVSDSDLYNTASNMIKMKERYEYLQIMLQLILLSEYLDSMAFSCSHLQKYQLSLTSSTLFLSSNSRGLRYALNIDLGDFKWRLTNSSSQKLQVPLRKPKKMETKNINKEWNATGS